MYRCVYHRCRMRCCPSSVLQPLRCVRLRPCIRKARSRLPLWIREILAYISVLVQSLYFNSLTDSDVIFDSVFEPVFLSVDYITRWFGTVRICSFTWNNNCFELLGVLCFLLQVFVCLVVLLTSSIVAIAYIVLLPLILNTYSPVWIVWHICYGHWNLIMIAFHYYKAAKTSPGYLPQVK